MKQSAVNIIIILALGAAFALPVGAQENLPFSARTIRQHCRSDNAGVYL